MINRVIITLFALLGLTYGQTSFPLCLSPGSTYSFGAADECVCISSPGYTCGNYTAMEAIIWDIMPSSSCTTTTISFGGDVFDVNGDPNEDCLSGDKIRILQNRRSRLGGRIKRFICGNWAPSLEPDRESTSDYDQTKLITISWESIREPTMVGAGFFMDICSSGCAWINFKKWVQCCPLKRPSVKRPSPLIGQFSQIQNDHFTLK